MERQYFKHMTERGVTISFKENNFNVSFGETPGNRHYEEYLKWLAEGNEPETINEVE